MWVVGAVGVVWAVRAWGSPGTHWQPLNTPNTYKRVYRSAGSGVGGGGGGGGAGGGGVGGSGQALAAFKYSRNTYKKRV